MGCPYSPAMAPSALLAALPPLPACPDGLLAGLPRLVPTWVLGLDEPRTLAGLGRALVDLARRDTRFVPLVAGLCTWAWQWRPLSKEFTDLLLTADALSPFLPAKARATAAALAARLPKDLPEAACREIVTSGEPRAIIRSLLPRISDPAEGLGWLAAATPLLNAAGRPELAASQAAAHPWPEALAALPARLAAERAFLFEAPEAARSAVLAMYPDIFGLLRTYLLAELAARQGETGTAATLLAGLLKRLPWQVNLTLKLAALAAPPAAVADVPGDAAVCLYSWNKAALLDQTLHSLAASELGGARLFCLDNGSSDATPEVLAAWTGRLGSRFTPVRLPVNVGAPSARNWLLALPEVAGAAWVAFLDDDVILPPDWLAHLLAAARSRPDVGAVGCRITAGSQPFGLQSADYNLLPPPGREASERLLVFDNCAGQLDFGLFSYARPCLSVSGCCHLLSRASLTAAGGFDLRFTPTQFDDLDRDLRCLLAGFPAFYEGRLAVRHVQHSSLAKAQSPAAVGNVLGNRVKLEGKYTAEEVNRLHAASQELLWADFKAACASVSELVRTAP